MSHVFFEALRGNPHTNDAEKYSRGGRPSDPDEAGMAQVLKARSLR